LHQSEDLPGAISLQNVFPDERDDVNSNQDQLATAVKVQFEEHARMATLLESRRNELDSQLVKMLRQVCAFDAEVKDTIELLTTKIERAEKLTREIDLAITKFADFIAAPR
jgi:hypothetical protein